MKTVPILLAPGVTSAATAACAQSAHPVTFYGRAYLMVESVEAGGGAAPIARRTRVSDRNSILGVRGSEDLGGGLQASEFADVDNKAGNLCNFGTSPLTISAGQDPRGFGAGLRHVF